MLATLIIVFREVIEAGLIIGIVLAATKGVRQRAAWVTGGILFGLLGASIVAFSANSINSALQGMGQELFNATILILAVILLTFHNVWMARHGRQMAQDMRDVSADVVAGKRSLFAIAAIVSIAVLREGSEIVLFLYGIVISGNDNFSSMILGGILGCFIGVIITGLTYYGLLNLPMKYLFSVTECLIAFLAAGMASQAIFFLQQADVVTTMSSVLWNSSHYLSENSLTGKALHTLIGYTDRPTEMQFIVYFLTLGSILLLMKVFRIQQQAPNTIDK